MMMLSLISSPPPSRYLNFWSWYHFLHWSWFLLNAEHEAAEAAQRSISSVFFIELYQIILCLPGY